MFQSLQARAIYDQLRLRGHTRAPAGSSTCVWYLATEHGQLYGTVVDVIDAENVLDVEDVIDAEDIVDAKKQIKNLFPERSRLIEY